ncbi:MAG: restriction endonuclease subunit S [Bacteroidales bacterium]|nr:restriction endonuclease subunit S [Bacteroidales bacterium]
MNDNQHIPFGYKPSPLGIIPEDWEVRRLGEIFTFKNGVNASKESYGEGVKFVNTMDVLNNTFIDSNVLRGKVNVNDKIKKEFIVSSGDVLFNRTSETREEVGCSAVYTDSEEAVFGGFIIRAHDIKSNILDLLYKGYCFQPSYIRNQISALGNGAIRYNLGQEDLSRVKLLIPPLPEQQRIVSLLSLWDTAIAKQTALIEQLTLRKRGLMQQLLTGKKRLKGFEGGSFHRLGNYISECNRRNNGCNRVLSVTNTRGFILQEEQFDKIVASNDTSNYKVVRRGEFAYNPSRVNVGSLAMLKEYDEGILSPMYIVFKANGNIDKTYLLQCLQSWWFRGHIPAYTQGSVRDSLSFDGLCSMKFYIPTLQEQKAISVILEQADKEIEIKKQKLAAMQEQKKGLMQVLLTGKKKN